MSMPPTHTRSRTGAGMHFYDRLVPTLPVGSYQIEVSNAVGKLNTSEHTDNDTEADKYFSTPRQQRFVVRSPRFALPDSAVHAVYPAPNSTSTYDQMLAHVTLDRAALPWEVRPNNKDEQTVLPWVTVLLFATGELPGDPAAVGRTTPRTVDKLRAPEENEVLIPDRDAMAEITQPDKAISCQTVDIPFGVFNAIAPTLAELPYLAHVRLGEDEAASTQALAAQAQTARDMALHRPPAPPPSQQQCQWETRQPTRATGEHAVVVGNRFPSPAGGQYVAHLVSLEGCLGYLPTAGRPAPRADRVGKTLRLVSLRAWSFRSLPDVGPHFGALVEAMAEPSRTDPHALALRAAGQKPPDDNASEVDTRRWHGYHPVRYGLRSGEHTVAWYRGPLTPVPAPPLPTGLERTRSADARLIYLPDTGMFDITYACAWSLGRALALSDPEFGPALMRWRATVRRAAGQVAGSEGPGHGSLAGSGHVPHGDSHAQFRQSLARLPHTLTLPRGARVPDLPSEPAQPPLTQVRERVASPQHRAEITKQATEHQPLSWLDQLAMLQQVPIEHLIPDATMLPAESLRFFYIDRGWQHSLLDGALSIGVATSLDAELTTLLHKEMDDSLPARMSGFLVRSALAPNWPSLRMACWQGTRQLNVLRCATVAPDTILVLVDGVLDRLTLTEPAQGLHFGYEIDHEQPHGFIQLRRLTGKVGAQLPQRVEDFTRRFLDSNRVLAVSAVVADITTRLQNGGPSVRVGAAGLAIQLVKAAEQITFAFPGS